MATVLIFLFLILELYVFYKAIIYTWTKYLRENFTKKWSTFSVYYIIYYKSKPTASVLKELPQKKIHKKNKAKLNLNKIKFKQESPTRNYMTLITSKNKSLPTISIYIQIYLISIRHMAVPSHIVFPRWNTYCAERRTSLHARYIYLLQWRKHSPAHVSIHTDYDNKST